MRTAACLAPIALALLAAGCGKKDTDPGPGGVTVAEAKALDQAAEMLEQRRLPAAAIQDDKPAANPAATAAAAAPTPSASATR